MLSLRPSRGQAGALQEEPAQRPVAPCGRPMLSVPPCGLRASDLNGFFFSFTRRFIAAFIHSMNVS